MKPIVCIVVINVMAVVLVGVAPPGAVAAIPCTTVISDLSKCLPYVTNKGPIGDCCSGVKKLYSTTKTTPDKQAVCNCLKTLAASASGLNPSKAAGLPNTCGVSIPYQISPKTNCSKVQ